MGPLPLPFAHALHAPSLLHNQNTTKHTPQTLVSNEPGGCGTAPHAAPCHQPPFHTHLFEPLDVVWVVCRAKILEDNAPSLALFDRIGFHETKRVAVFHEVHLELDVAPGTQARQQLEEQQLQCGAYSS